MFLSRVLCPDGRVELVLRQGSEAAFALERGDIGTLALRAESEGISLGALLLRRGLGDPADVAGLLAKGLLLSPLPEGRLVLLPAGPGDEMQPVHPVDPGAGLHLAPHGALEGGVARIGITAPDGRLVPIGWLQTHAATAGATRPRHLAAGPELCLVMRGRPLSGQTRLARDRAVLTEFSLPDADLSAPAPLPDAPAGSVVVQRQSRWLLRPRAEHLDASVETAIPALGLPLRNPLGAGVALAADRPAPLWRQA